MHNEVPTLADTVRDRLADSAELVELTAQKARHVAYLSLRTPHIEPEKSLPRGHTCASVDIRSLGALPNRTAALAKYTLCS